MNQITLFLVSLLFISTSFSQTHDASNRANSSRIYSLKKGIAKVSVVFVSGLGEDHKTWQSVQDSISNFATTVSYDRAGLGKTPYNGEKKDLTAMVEELQAVIIANKLKGKIILVGHSLGSQIVKQYASSYPNKVRGLIFLDPGFDETKLRSRLDDSTWAKRTETLKKYMPVLDAARQAEFDHLNANCKTADQITTLPRVPVVLFTATRVNTSFPGSTTEFAVKLETHKLWLQTLPAAKHIEVKESRHYIHNDRPDLVIKSVAEIISKTR